MTAVRITVVGSVNLDFVATAATLPAPGETVTGATLARHPGGKGANQALAARRLGAEVTLVGRVGADAMADGIGWHVKHWGRLLQKLRDTEDLDGSSMIDSTAAILCFEGGWGYDPEQDAEGSAHSSENMGVLIGGKAGGLNASGGQHLRATGRHPAEVINTAMRAVGVSTPLGEVSGSFDELIG